MLFLITASHVGYAIILLLTQLQLRHLENDRQLKKHNLKITTFVFVFQWSKELNVYIKQRVKK